MSERFVVICCFCAQSFEVALEATRCTVAIEFPDGATQGFYVHTECLVRRIPPGACLDPELDERLLGTIGVPPGLRLDVE